MGSYTVKKLETHIILAEGGYDTRTGEAANTKILRLGTDVEISKPGGKEKNKAKVRIYNLPMDDMQVLTTLAFQPLEVSKNGIAIYAGDDDNGLSLAFSGDIVSAVPNFNTSPDPSFDIDCVTGYVASVTPVPPLTAAGAQDVAMLMAAISSQVGMAFANRDVTTQIRNPAIVGGPMEQAYQLADIARISLIVDDGEMVISQPGTLRTDDGGNTPVLGEGTGLLGYPSFDNEGVNFKCIYEPRLELGGPVRIKSIVPRASGLWQITSIHHKLQANYPGAGTWESEVKATYPGGGKKKTGDAAKK